MRLRDEPIPYEVDGVDMVGSLQVDDDRPGPRASVLVLGGGRGFEPFHRERARRLAELGYCAFGADYDGGGRVLELGAPRGDRSQEHVDRLAPAALDALLARPECDPARVAVLGYCFGGGLAMQLARTGADLKAVVGFHPGIGPIPDAGANRRITGRVLVCIGTDDPYVSREERVAWESQMDEAGVDWSMEVYGGVQHVFTDPGIDALDLPGCAYDRRSDERSWAALLRLLAETIGPLD